MIRTAASSLIAALSIGALLSIGAVLSVGAGPPVGNELPVGAGLLGRSGSGVLLALSPAPAAAPAPAPAPDQPPARTPPLPSAAARGSEPWVWPTGVRVVERPWQAPDDDYSAGHRGLDVPAPLGTAAVAVDDGVVAFAGQVGGRPLVTIDHGDGVVSTLDSLDPAVEAGDEVRQGAVVGRVVAGHCPASAPCLHLGARVDGRYVDPTPFLPPAAWPVLLPESAWPG